MKPSGIGGQAVLEGIMMKNKDKYAVAVRKPDKTIVVETKEYVGIADRISLFKLPIIRGVVMFFESLILGVKIMAYSASFYEDETAEEEYESEIKKGKKEKKEKKEKKTVKDDLSKKEMPEGVMNAITVMLSVVLAVGIFMVLPYIISQLLNNVVKSQKILTLFEGIIRILLFIGFVYAISLMEDIKRVFMYHGAEHKAINCIENGYNLTVENVKRQSRNHKRCGTSFSLYVIFISVIFFMFINLSSPLLRILLRLVLIPVIAGISYEFIRFAGRTDNKFVNMLSKPGMMLQRLTTREPDKDMIEIAIASVEAVFDWKQFLSENEKEASQSKTGIKKKTTETSAKKLLTLNEVQEEGLNNLDKVLDVKDVVKNRITKDLSINRRSASFDPGTAITKEDEEEDDVLMALDKYFIFNHAEDEEEE